VSTKKLYPCSIDDADFLIQFQAMLYKTMVENDHYRKAMELRHQLKSHPGFAWAVADVFCNLQRSFFPPTSNLNLSNQKK
jgi:hypothetical protein